MSKREQEKLKRMESCRMKILILGSSEGIGKQISLKYGRMMPYAQIILVSRNVNKMNKVKLELEQERKMRFGNLDFGIVEIVPCDVTVDADVDHSIQFVSEKFSGILCGYSLIALIGSVDRIIWNAGVLSSLSVEELSRLENSSTIVNKLMDLNLMAPIKFTLKSLNLLKSSDLRGKSIVIVSSLGGRISAPTRSIYCASKAGLNAFFDAFRCEMKKYGINVTIVCPASVETNLRDNSVENQVSQVKQVSSKKTERKLTAVECANGIFYAAENGLRDMWLPRFYQLVLPLVQILYPELLDDLGRKKYNYH